MHNYLKIFKDYETARCLSMIRISGNIPIETGTLSNLHAIERLNLPDNLLASIQLYEYLLYDFLLNSSFHEKLNDRDRQCLYTILNQIFEGTIIYPEKNNIIDRDLNIINSIISKYINHNKYCDLLARIQTPDYIKILRDKSTTQNLEYLRIQNGISILLGTASKPEVLENSLWPQNYKSSIQLYEYIFYDFFMNSKFHESLSETEKKSFFTVFQAICDKNLFKPQEEDSLKSDISITNQIIGRWINNKKYFKLFGETELANENDKMNINDSDSIIHIEFLDPNNIQKGIEYYKSMKKAS